MFPQINVHIITWVCGSYKTYCSGVSQVLAQRCWHQYVCSPISVPKVSYTIIFKASWALACNLCLLMKSYIIYEMYMKLKKEYKTADVWISDPGKTWEVFEMLKCKKSLETKQTELLLPRTFLIFDTCPTTPKKDLARL